MERSRKTESDIAGVIMGLLMYFFFWGLSGVVGIFTWPYILNTLLVLSGKTAEVVWWQGFLIGLVPIIGKMRISVPLAIIVWVIMLFV